MKKSERQKKLVYVAMSGGVDSSVAAALLKYGDARLPAGRQGFDVVGVFFKPWQPRGITCLWRKEREDAMRVATALKIPLKTWDFSREYEKRVTRYMIREYEAGRTPNPDVMCNKEIKFGLFLKKALREGADYIATGHYARIKQVNSNQKSVNRNTRPKNRLPFTVYRLQIATDRNKDQTYFLWTLGQKELSRTLFPVGGFVKPQVRALAKKFRISVHDKKDSQGVCFIGPLNMHDFLKRYIRPKPGRVLHIDGRPLGMHDGVRYYTIGQRHGMNITAGGGPYYVISKDIRKNILFVGPEENLSARRAVVSGLHFISGTPEFPAKISVKIRYRTPAHPAVLSVKGVLTFSKPVRAITPGQSAVLYSGKNVIGGGIIR